MANFIIMVGASGSGKSTLIQTLKDVVVICPDAIRAELALISNPFLSQADAENDQSKNEEVWKITIARIVAMLRLGHTVVLDATNPNRKARKYPIEIARQAGAKKIIAYYIASDIADCKARNKRRERRVPDDVIDKQFERLSVPTLDEVNEVYIYKNGEIIAQAGV